MCLNCGKKSNYRPSSRIHGSPPKKFFICASCSSEVQGVENADGSIHEFPTGKYRGGTNMVSLRLNDNQHDQFKSTGLTSRQVFELGLTTVVKETDDKTP
jgi:hypothetical protein